MGDAMSDSCYCQNWPKREPDCPRHGERRRPVGPATSVESHTSEIERRFYQYLQSKESVEGIKKELASLKKKEESLNNNLIAAKEQCTTHRIALLRELGVLDPSEAEVPVSAGNSDPNPKESES
jgi:hypothetical protein